VILAVAAGSLPSVESAAVSADRLHAAAASV